MALIVELGLGAVRRNGKWRPEFSIGRSLIGMGKQQPADFVDIVIPRFIGDCRFVWRQYRVVPCGIEHTCFQRGKFRPFDYLRRQWNGDCFDDRPPFIESNHDNHFGVELTADLVKHC